MGSDASILPAPGALAPGTRTWTEVHHRRNWERASARGLGVVGGVALVLLVALSLGLVVAAAERASFLSPPSHASFPGWLAGPFKGVFPPLTKNHDKLKWAFSLGVAAMYLCYLLVLLCAPRLRAKWVIGAVVLLHIIFFVAPPLSLTDVFNYINYGRMGYVHHLNPYTTIPALEPHTDPAFAFSNWHHLLSPYGPLFTLYTYALAPLGVSTGFWILKLSLALASLSTLFLVWRCAVLLGRDPLPAFMFVGLNPLVLVWGLGGDHNDFFMVFWILLAFYLVLSSRAPAGRRPGGWAWGNGARATGAAGRHGSPGAGYLPTPARSPAVGPAPTRSWEGARGRYGTSPYGAGTSTVRGAVAGFAGPSGSAWSSPGVYGRSRRRRRWRDYLGGLSNGRARPGPMNSVPPGPGAVLREGGAGMALAVAIGIKASAGILLPIMVLGIRRSRRLLAGAVLGGLIVAAVSLYTFGAHLPNLADQERLVVGTGLPNLLGYALGLGGETAGLHSVLTGVLIVAVLACSVWAWRTRDWLRPATAAMLVLLLTLSWELPWYVYWLLPLAALVRSRALRAAALVLGLYLLLAWIPLMTDVIKGVNFRPTASALGEQNARLTKRLLH